MAGWKQTNKTRYFILKINSMPTCKQCKDKFIPKYFLQKHCMKNDVCVRAELDMKYA